ncbi:MAG: dTMP kinase [Acidimicrobiia bacterium]|nr:dTMP kinase [Acidimicrobiia bacterium]
MTGDAVAGRFVVLEGGEGSGKSTQVPLLAQRLGATGREVVVTFEPGATKRGAELRRFLLHDGDPLDARAELLVMAADRAQHVAQVVRPALARGADVVCDRFEPSSLAYQGAARGLGVEAVESVSRWATGGLVADLVVVLDVPDDLAESRVPEERDRLESEGRRSMHRCAPRTGSWPPRGAGPLSTALRRPTSWPKRSGRS